ncbi:putative mitochondrial protein AtMg00820 [Apium graveolens]|uniref:putative mitochondrial protein AtMg00820 n=1 Tax=Apium graveolens TaxID=4045 RepID=UPI003D799DE8
MNDELDTLENNHNWAITTLPPGKNAITSKWLYKTKFKPDGIIDKFKSRLVILGNKQTYDIDYSETFALVAKLTTVRTLLAVAAIQKWEMVQMDVSNAYLINDLDEHVNMKFPK